MAFMQASVVPRQLALAVHLDADLPNADFSLLLLLLLLNEPHHADQALTIFDWCQTLVTR